MRVSRRQATAIADDLYICSVFGAVEALAADMMIKDGRADRIEVKDFPRGAPLLNDKGALVRFAVAMPAERRREYDELVESLRP
jgi:hypothetical protein